jgi:uncharacterized protein YndB with AHSA1/START domain
MPDIYHLVFIQSTPEKIYDAITTEKGIASWWSKTNNAISEAGSIYRIYFGPVYYKEIRITEFVLNKKVTWEILDAHPEWVNTKIVFDIHVAENNTELRFRNSGWKDYTDMFAQCNHHWGIFLLNLKAYVETGKTFVMNEFGKDIPGGHEK